MQTIDVRQLANDPGNILTATRSNDFVVVMDQNMPHAVLVGLDQLQFPDLDSVRLALAISLFRNGSVSTGFAARMAGKSLSEMLKLLSNMGIPVTGDTEVTVDEVLSEIDAAQAWVVRTDDRTQPRVNSCNSFR
jgi:hypothetical protein